MTHKERRVKIKTVTKERLKSNSSNPYIAALIMGAVIIGIMLTAIISIVIPMIVGAIIQYKAGNNFLSAFFLIGGNIGNKILNIVISCLFIILTIGFSWYTYKIYIGKENEYKDIFDAFSKRGFWTFCANLLVNFFIGIVVFVLTLIVMIPMIFIVFVCINKNMSIGLAVSIIILIWIICIPSYIFKYCFRLINYIMYDDSEISVDKALFKSYKLMRGHKWELFKLDLTFIGWNFITIITLGIAGIYTMPYIYTVYAGFYEEIKKEAVNLK